MPLDLLWLLLPVAAASGWFLARRDQPRTGPKPGLKPTLSTDYLRGLNYLLNEQPDKAIEVFIDMLQVDSDTVETHLALGNLFRRRGEVERAIRVHQNIIARPALDVEQRSEALFELGQDYMKAGLLDRAEALFKELTDVTTHHLPALRLLQDIYQQEKDWDTAISIVHRQEKITGQSNSKVIAHYYCELARKAQTEDALPMARSHLKRALAADRSCARASILEGRMDASVGNYRAALRAYQRVEHQNPSLLSEVIDDIQLCYEKLGQHKALAKYLQRILPERGGSTAHFAYAKLLHKEKGVHAAVEYLRDHLESCPSLEGLELLLELETQQDDSASMTDLQPLRAIIGKMRENKKTYRCQHCGFSGRTIHWQCPGCKNWDVVVPQACMDTSSGSLA